MRSRRGALVSLALVLGMLAGPGVAAAAPAYPAPAKARPSECLAAFDDESTDYVGEGWRQALVATARDPESGRDVRLFCGDERSGVVHITHPDTDGTGHPVSAGDDENAFLACFQRVIQFGRRGPNDRFPDRSTHRFVYTEGRGPLAGLTVSATVFVDTQRNFVYSMFAGPTGHDWTACALAGASFEA